MYAASHSFWSLQTMSVYHINWHVILIELLKIPIPGVNSAVEISLYRVLNFIDKIREVKLGNSKEVGDHVSQLSREVLTLSFQHHEQWRNRFNCFHCPDASRHVWCVLLINLVWTWNSRASAAVIVSFYWILNLTNRFDKAFRVIEQSMIWPSLGVPWGELGRVREISRQRNRLLVSLRDQDQRGMPGYREFEKAWNFFREGYSDFVFVFVMYSHSLIHAFYPLSISARPELNPKQKSIAAG